MLEPVRGRRVMEQDGKIYLGEHDDLFDGLQTMVEGATSYPTVRAYRHAPFARWEAAATSISAL